MAEQSDAKAGLDATVGEDGEVVEPDLYDIELERFQSVLAADTDAALRQYGFTLFHTLPASKQVELQQKLGFDLKTANGYYGLAHLAIEREDYKAAASLLQKCLAADESREDALFNLALCQEKLGNKKDALAQWNRFVEVTTSDADREQVTKHLESLSQ